MIYICYVANVVVHLFATKTVSTPGDQFYLQCLDTSRTASSVQWLVNRTLLENSRLENAFNILITYQKQLL